MKHPLSKFVRTGGAVGLGVVSIVAGAILISPLRSAFADEAPPSVSAPVPGQSEKDALPNLPTLSPVQEARALDAALSYPLIRTLVAGREVSTLVVPWTTLKEGRLLGAGVEITWKQPTVVTGRWPTLYYDETEQISPPYILTAATIDAANVTGVHLQIDLSAGKVLHLEPLPGATINSYDVDPAARAGLPPQPKRRR